MFLILYLCILCIFQGAHSNTHCIVPEQSDKVFVRCELNSKSVPCGRFVYPGTEINFQCDQYYKLDNQNSTGIKCLESGNWNHPEPQCIPDCGKVQPVIPLVVHGQPVSAGVFPWHAALYELVQNNWEFLCGGSLISERMIITAAHCAWRQPPEKLKVALGKFYRNFTEEEENSQIIQVSQVELLDSYQDFNGNYNGDLAILVLQDSVIFTDSVLPVCIDWKQEYTDIQLEQGNSGISLGWGITENDTFSEELRAIRMPVMSDDHCIKEQDSGFKKYVTYTSFCAGYTNGSGVCNGDSGGGLTFLDTLSDIWYLQGIVSVSPRRRGTSYCDPKHYTVFTKVSAFTPWLQKMEEKEKKKAEALAESVLLNGVNIRQSIGSSLLEIYG